MPVVHSGQTNDSVRISFEQARPLLQQQLAAALEAEAAATELYAPFAEQLVALDNEIAELQRQALALSHQAPRTAPAEEYFRLVEARDDARAALNDAKHRNRLLLRRAEPYSALLGSARGAVRRARRRLQGPEPHYREVTNVPLAKFDEMGITVKEIGKDARGRRVEIPASTY